jgi:starvation-inducible outer membrane lipoprotein
MPGITLSTQPNRGPHLMTPYARLQRWSAYFTMVITMVVILWGCASEPLAKVRLVNVPRHYVWMAEPDTTLTALIADPERYRGKVVILGGTIIEEAENEQDLWLHVTNRPLDQDYIPQIPADKNGPEGGSYWVVVTKQQFPRQYREWARMTMVGRVTGVHQYEPVLSLLYVRGWGLSSAHLGVWEHVNPNYMPSTPGGIKRY